MIEINRMTEVLKWAATAICIIGAFINGMGYHPEGPIVLVVGGLIWLIVGVRWKEMSIVVTNIAMVAASIIGMAIPHVMPIIQAYLG